MASFPYPALRQPIDPEAVFKARSTFDAFFGARRSPRRSMAHFSVLAELAGSDRPQWFDDIDVVDGRVVGVPANAIDRQGPDRGELEIRQEKVLDWLYVHNCRLIGGFTFRDRVMEVMDYFDDLSSDVPIGLDRPSEEDWDYWDEIDDFCLPLDEDHRIGPAFELFDAIGNLEHKLVADLLERHDCVNTWCEIATGFTGTVRREMLTPLLYAILLDDESSAMLCLDAGARINAQQGDKMTPLHWASMGYSPDVVRRLLSLGAPIEAHAADGRTPLTCATSSGQIDCMRVLIEHGANVNNHYMNIRELDGVMTGIVGPVLVGNLNIETARVLYDAGAHFDVADAEGFTPLHGAAFNNEFDLAEFLLEIGCDPTAKDKEGLTPPMRALEFPKDREAAVRFAKLCERYEK